MDWEGCLFTRPGTDTPRTVRLWFAEDLVHPLRYPSVPLSYLLVCVGVSQEPRLVSQQVWQAGRSHPCPANG